MPNDRPSNMKIFLLVLSSCLAFMGAPQAQTFKFSTAENEDTAPKEAQQAKVAAMLQTPCRSKIKNQKIMVLIGEDHNGRVVTSQTSFSAHFDAINARLQTLGLRPFTQAKIKARVAQAEIDAYFRNDPDAAISASRKMAAQYILRGFISTQASRNAMIRVNQVNVRMNFTLTSAAGKAVSQTSAESASYAGQDTAGMALTLINEKADEVVATLYSDYCNQAGFK